MRRHNSQRITFCSLMVKLIWLILSLLPRAVCSIYRRCKEAQESRVYEEVDTEPEPEETQPAEDILPLGLDTPEFTEIIVLRDVGEEQTTLGIERYAYCPDLTAIIRVLTDKEMSKQYKKRVLFDKRGEAYLNLADGRHYLKKAGVKND